MWASFDSHRERERYYEQETYLQEEVASRNMIESKGHFSLPFQIISLLNQGITICVLSSELSTLPFLFYMFFPGGINRNYICCNLQAINFFFSSRNNL